MKTLKISLKVLFDIGMLYTIFYLCDVLLDFSAGTWWSCPTFLVILTICLVPSILIWSSEIKEYVND